jgi:hypothetical protein
MNATKNAELFTDLTTGESATLQGGCRWHSYYRPYYYYRPNTYSYTPRYNYGYGYGGYSSGSVSQTTNVNVVYDD